MKHSHHHNNPPTEPQLVPVRFEFDNPAAVSVCVAGCFNHWNPSAKPMHRTTDGHWLKESALPAGRYEYRLVVDGAWMADPLAKESVANPFGGNNSVLNVTTPVAAPQTEPPRVSSKQTNNQKASKV